MAHLRYDPRRGILEVNGVKFALDMLITIANPEENNLYRFCRKGDVVHVTRVSEGEAE